MKKAWISLCLLAVLCSVAHAQGPPALRTRNTFRTPEEVVRYYCERDAAGFVWSGLLEVERKAFTTWAQAPQKEGFWLARGFRIGQARLLEVPAGTDPEAAVEVVYAGVTLGDPGGGRVRESGRELRVRFKLRRQAGRWKITEPGPEQLAPVLVESPSP